MTDLVIITDSDLPNPGTEERILIDAGLTVQRAHCTTSEEVIEVAQAATALIVQWVPITPAVFEALPGIRIISRLGIGYDMVDVEAATRYGVAVANTPEYCIEEVVTHTLAGILALLRGVLPLDQAVRSGRWGVVGIFPAACRPSTTTIAIIGYGRIGRGVAAVLVALGFRVLVCDPYADVSQTSGLVGCDLETALSKADLVTLHAPLTDETRHMINEDSLAAMRPGALLVNTCRGDLVDEDAVARALHTGTLGGAALDVFTQEPLPGTSPLRDAPNLILSPHAAWYSPAALADLPLHAARNVVRFLAGDGTSSIVNPEYLECVEARR